MKNFRNTSQLIEESLRTISAAAESKDHPMHFVILSSVSNNQPETRYVVWRKFDKISHVGWIFTDIRSTKISQIKTNPKTQLLFYNKDEKLQIKATGIITIHNQNELARKTYEELDSAHASITL